MDSDGIFVFFNHDVVVVGIVVLVPIFLRPTHTTSTSSTVGVNSTHFTSKQESYCVAVSTGADYTYC